MCGEKVNIIQFQPELEFILNLTHKCNLMCKMCTQYGEGYKENSSKEMDFEDWKKFLLTIIDYTPQPTLILMGGEPFLYKDFKKIFLKNLNIHLNNV